MNKKYELSVKANKKSVEQLKADLTNSLNAAFENLDTAGKVKLSRSDKAAIKADLSSLFGIADEQADALRKMVQGIIPSDTKSIDHMKSQLQDTLKFATGIMEQMKLLGDSTDWMKQGVSFVDKFVAMQGTLLETQNVVSGIQVSVDKLTESFKTFKDALALTNNDAYLKRFSSEAKLAVDDVIKAQEILNKVSKSKSQKIRTLSMANNVDVTDYTDMSAEDIREEYTSIIQAIKDGNAEIERLEAEFKGKKTKLYDSKEYQMQLRGLATEVQNLQNLSKHPLFKDAFSETGAQISANLKAVTTEITNAAEKAGRELKDVIESLKGEGIEISVTLPDPDAAEFGAKISEFVSKASAQFKKKPVEISLDLSNPFKDAKKIKEQTAQGRKIKGLKEIAERNAAEVGVAIGDSLQGLDTTDTSRIVQNVVESFNKVYNAIKTGQLTITEATNQWRKDMLKALTLKATFDSTEAKAEVSTMMQELQNYLDENKPLYINTDTDELVRSIQQALNEAKFTVDVKAGNIDGSGVVSNVQIGQILNGLSNIQLVSTDDSVTPHQQGKALTPSKTATATATNTEAVKESTREQRILTDAVKSLQNSINQNNKKNESSQATIKQIEDKRRINESAIKEAQKKKDNSLQNKDVLSESRRKMKAELTSTVAELERVREERSSRSRTIYGLLKDGNVEQFNAELSLITQALQKERQELLSRIDDINNSRFNEEDKVVIKQQIQDDIKQAKKVRAQLELERKNVDTENISDIEKVKKHEDFDTQIAKIDETLTKLHSYLNDMSGMSFTEETKKLKIKPLENRIGQIDSVLNGDVTSNATFDEIQNHYMNALKVAYASIIDKLQSDVTRLQSEIDRYSSRIASVDLVASQHQASIDKLEMSGTIENSQNSIERRNKENNQAQKRINNIKNVLESGHSPATLVLDEVNKFWAQSSKTIERTKNEIVEGTEALKKLNPDSEDYQKLYNEVQKKQKKVDTWKQRQALMSQKGLVDMSGMGLEEAIQTLTDVLRKSPTLSDELLHSDGLKSLSSSKNIAYYANVAQEALGFRTQTEQEYVDEKTLQAKFVELFRINEFLKKVNSMFPKGGAEPNVDAVEGFINFFEKVPEMSSAVESAKKYLDELKNVAELQDNDEMFKTFKESGLEDQYFPQRAQELWGKMDDSIRTTLSQELSSRGIDAKNFANLEDASDAFEQMKLLYKEGVFDSVKSENADFQQLITLLKQSTAVDSTRKSLQTSLQGITTSFEGRLRSVLFEAINTGEPISVKVVDNRGNERVYDIHDQGRGKLDSDRSFSTNTKSLNQFLRISGLEKQMSEIVYAMFNDPDLAKTLIDNLFADGKVQLASKKNAFLPKSSQKYTFNETPLGQYIKNEEKNAKEREKLEAELIDLKAGKYSESLSKRLEALPVDKQTEAINSIIALKERQLASIQKLDLTEDQIAQSLVALADDIEIAEAKMQKSQQGSRQSDKKAQRLLKDETNSWTYQTAQKKAKNATFDKDYNLKQLFERIDIADTFGLMDTSMLLELADEYETKQKEARELTDLNKAGLVGKDKVDAAWDELRKARKTLIEEYYKTEGWYLTNLAQSRMETAENEIRRMNKDTPEGDIVQFLHIQGDEIIRGLKGKSDVQLMAERYNTSSANNKADAQNEAAILAEKKKQLKSLMEKYGVTTEMLEAERNLTRVSSESVDATKNTVDNITQESSRSSGSNGVMSHSGLVGVLNSSNLATESTLRGLYEILNGGAPKGGWDNENTFASGVKDELDLSVHSFSSNLTGLAGGIKRFVDSVRNASLENMAFFNDVERVGNAIKGTENGVEGSKIKSFLNRHKSDSVKLALHNHPDGISALSPADIQSAIALVSKYGVGMAGSVVGNKVTGVDFSGISKEIGLKILDAYKDNIKKSKFSEIFDDNFEIKEEFANSANIDRQKLSDELNKLLQNAISSVGLNPDDIFGQIDVSKLDSATKQIANQIIESSANAAVEASKKTKQANNTSKSGLDIARNYYSSRNLSDKQVEHSANKLVNHALQYAFGQDPNGTNKFYFMGSKEDANKLDLNYYIDQYKAIDNILQLIGYHLDELQPNMIDSKNQWGFSAQVVANSDHVVTNLEEARKILFGLQDNKSNKIVETTKTSVLNLNSFDAATTKELAQYISGNFKKDNGKNVSGSRPLSAAMYDMSRLDIFAEEFKPTDVNNEQLAKAWNQLQVGMTQEVAKQLNDDIKAYIQLLQFKLQEIADANGLDYNAINSAVNARKVAAQDISGTKLTKESVEATKQYLATFTKTNKKGNTVKQTGISRAQSGLKNVYSVLSNGRDTLTNANLKDLGTGYYQLVETINHEIFSKLNKETQELLIQARDAALATLDKYGVKVYGSGDLQNQVISDDTKNLIKGGKVGHKFDSMTAPALVKTVTDTDGSTQDKVLQKAQGRIVAEKAITEEKKKQKKLSQEGTQQEAKTTQEVQERSQAEQKATENKKKGKTTQPKTSSDKGSILPSNTIKVPESGNNQGGILGLLGKIAQESTLQSVLAQLSKGVKTSSGGEGGTKSSKKDDVVLSDSEALNKLQEKIKADYPEFASVSNSRAVSGGHAIDVFQYKNLDKIKEARADIARLNAEGKAGTDEWNEAQQRLNSLLTEQEKITLKINTATGEITTKSSFQNLAVGAKAASKELQNIDSIMSQLHDAGALSLGSDGTVTSSNQTVQNYLNSLRQLEIYKDSLSQDMLFDPSTQQQLSNLTIATQNYRKEVMSLLNATSKLNVGKIIDTDKLTKGIDGLSNDAIKTLMLDIVSDGGKLETTFKELIPVTDEFGEIIGYQLAYSVRNGKHEVQEMTAVLNPLTNELRVQKGAVKEVATGWELFFNGLKGKAASIMQYLISITSIHDIFRYMREGVQYVKEIDSALTELKKVTDETDASYARFLQDMSKTGSVIGATVADLTTSAADWARLGYTMQQAGELAKNTSILMNVSEFDDVSKATDTLISALQAFKKEGQDVGTFSMEIIDKYNEVGNNYAISTSDLAESLTRSSAALVAANNSLEQSIAMTTAANTTIQDPESVGNALKTVSMRIRGVKTELEEAGEDTSGMVTNTAKLQEKIMALTNIDGSGGVDILTRTGDFKSTYDILLEISKVWKDMGDVEQAECCLYVQKCA